MIRDYNGPSKWIPGVVIRKLGPVTYDVETTQGRTVKCHIDQIRLRNNTMKATEVPPVTKEDSGVLDNCCILAELVSREITRPSMLLEKVQDKRKRALYRIRAKSILHGPSNRTRHSVTYGYKRQY